MSQVGYDISVDVSTVDASAGQKKGLTGEFSSSQEHGNTSEIDISKSKGLTIQVNGPSQDGIDHDQDEIWLLLNPVIELSVTGKNIAWALSNSGTTAKVQFVTVGWLKNPSKMPRGVATALRNAGITTADYPKLLARDHFANGATNIDTTRFVPTDTTLPYELPGTTATYNITNDLTNKLSSSSKQEDSFTVTVKSGFRIGPVGIDLTNKDSFTWTNTSTYGTTTGSKQNASAAIAGPSASYAGATNVDVYYDTIYSTFLFAFDPDSTPTAQDANAAVRGVITSAGKPVAHEEVILTAGGRRFRTYTNSKGAYYFYKKVRAHLLPHATAGRPVTISVRKQAQSIGIGTTTIVHNRAL